MATCISPSQQTSSHQLIVNYLHVDVDEYRLWEMFGTVKTGWTSSIQSCNIVRRRHAVPQAGRSRGFGFVTYGKKEDADLAISTFDGTIVDGKMIVVSYSRPDPEARYANVRVKYISPKWTTEDLRREFAKYGQIITCRVVGRNLDGRESPWHHGFVRFNLRAEAERATIARNGVRFIDCHGHAACLAVTPEGPDRGGKPATRGKPKSRGVGSGGARCGGSFGVGQNVQAYLIMPMMADGRQTIGAAGRIVPVTPAAHCHFCRR